MERTTDREQILKKAYIQARENIILEEIKEIGKNSIVLKILKKDKWNGKDLGIFEMADLINSRRYYEKMDLIKYPDGIRKKLVETFNNLNLAEREVYYNYKNLRIWIINSYYLSMAHIQTRTGKYNYLMGRARDIFFTETAYNYFLHNIKETDKATNDLIEEYQKHYDKLYKPFSLYRYTEKDKEYKEHIEDINDALSETFSSYIFLKGYNKAIDIVANFFEIPDLKLFKYKGVIYIPEEYNRYNLIIDKVKDAVEHQVATKLERTMKIGTLQQVFKPLKTYYEIPEEKIKQAKDLLEKKEFTPFFSDKDILNILCK